jgi:predicted transcriptional regulator
MYLSHMKYRDRTEIITLILTSVSGVLKTKIMYEAFLSFSQLEEYIGLLLRNGLLEHDELKKTYKTTENGLRLLELYNSLHEIETNKDEKNSVIV